MKEFIGKHLRFLRRETEYLVIDNNSGDFRFSLIRPQGEGRHFQLVSQLLGTPGKVREETKIIISLSHRFATTFRMPVAIARAEPKTEITESELENVVSRGLWKLFNKQRRKAAEKMKVADIAVKVFDADIISVKLDGHRVSDPLGFCASELDLECQETLVVQPTLAALLELVPAEQIVSVQESPAAWPLLVCAQAKIKDFLAVAVLDQETILYRYTDDQLECIDTFGWGSRDIIGGVAKFLGMEPAEAQTIIDLYTKGNASPGVLKKVETVLSQELSILFKGIEIHRLGRETKQVFVASQFKIPEALLSARYIRKLGVDFVPTLLDAQWISEKVGYTLKSMDEASQPDDSVCAALAVYLQLQKDTLLSKIAKQRVRWL